MASEQLKSLRDRLIKGIEEEIASTPVDVLVLGPSVDGMRLRMAASLRKELLQRCSEFGAKVMAVAAEHKDLVAAARRTLGKNYNLCQYERRLAKECDLIIMLPASPGSYVELGLFALEDWACAKSLILFDVSCKDTKSFINLGPRRAYKLQRAIIKNVNYREKYKVLSIVKTIIDQVRVVKAGQKRFP